jgi:hypothetical protein
MKKIAGALGIVSLLVSGAAMAAGFSQYSTIASIEIDAVSSGMSSTYLSFASSVSSNRPACATASLALMSGSTDSVKTMTSLATAAYLGGKSVRVYWDGTCDGTYGRITAIEVK